MISEQQRQAFVDRGLVRLEKVIPQTTVAALRARANRTIERAGHWQDGGWLGDPLQPFESQLSRRVKNALKDSPALEQLVTSDLLNAVDLLVEGRTVRPMTTRPQVLFTAPNTTAWALPHKIWHLDVPRLGALGLPGVQMFALLDSVAPRAGGTLLVAGSHRLLNDTGMIRSKDVKRRLKREDYFRALFQRGEADRQHFLDEVSLLGCVELQVVELCGEPGDVFLTDLRLLHTVAPNASRIPRLMATQRFVLAQFLDQIAKVEQKADAA